MIRPEPYGVTNDIHPAPFTHTNSLRTALRVLFRWI